MADAVGIGVALGLMLSPLAGLMAFLITYEEYRHHCPDRAPAIRAGLQAGAWAFAVFLVLSLTGAMLAREVAR